MEYLHMQIQSEAAKTPLPLDVLLPSSKGPHKSLYLLHDLAGNNTSWIRKTQIENELENAGVALIMPSCLNSFYTNMYYGYDMLDYVTNELIQMCESWFDLEHGQESRMIAGIGMGGYGAVLAALRAPSKYKAAYAIDGMLDPGHYYENPLPALNMNDVMGPQEFYYHSDNYLPFAASHLSHNPYHQVRPTITLFSTAADQNRQDAVELQKILTGDGLQTELICDVQNAVAVMAEKVRAW